MSHHDRRRLTLALALLGTLVGLLAAGAGAQGVLPLEPNFSSNPDILGGRRFLLRIDDLLVVNLAIAPAEQHAPQINLAHTSNSQVNDVAFAGAFLGLGNPNPAYATAVSRADEMAPQALGRMYNLPRDVVVSVLMDVDGKWHVFVDNETGSIGTFSDTIVPTSIAPAAGGQSAQAVVLADVDGDGYAEAVIAYLGQDAQGQRVEALRIVKAVDVNDVGKGVRFGPELIFAGGQGLFAAPLSTLRTGDLDGNGFPEIIGFNGTTLSVASVDPQTLSIAVAKTVPLPNSEVLSSSYNVIAGRFRNTGFDDVVVIGQRLNDSRYRLTSYSFGGDPGQPSLDIRFNQRLVYGAGDPMVHVFLAKGPLRNWFSGQDLLVIGVAGKQKSFVLISESDDNLNFALVSVTTASQKVSGGLGCLYGLGVGNFDNRQPNGDHAFPLQVATLWRFPIPDPLNRTATCDDYTAVEGTLNLSELDLRLWSVSPKVPSGGAYPDWLAIVSDSLPHVRLGELSSFASLRVGDLQGRSLALGAPEKVTILGHLQPDVVLGLPPMHIDWVSPRIALDPALFPGCDQPLAPCQLNLTVLPSVPAPGKAFSTQYDLVNSTSATSSRKSTTSWSLGVKETVDSKTTYGTPSVDEVSVEVKQSAGYTHDGTVATAHDTYAGKTESINVATGFADYVFFTQHRQNVYYYPVIGRTTCEPGPFQCVEPAVQKPLFVSFSGPDQVFHQSQDASSLEWYQPAHEPGNVLSYPWNLDQLQQAFATSAEGLGLTPLTDFQWKQTDTSDVAYKTAWSNSAGQSKSSGSVNAESFSLSVTVSGTATVAAARFTGSAELDLNQSASVSTHNATTQTVSSSFGIQVAKPPFPSAVESTYEYNFGGYILGVNSARPAPQDNLAPTDETGKPVDVTTTGPMLMAFVADPLLPPAVPWWRQAYSVPDVGLNHPERWDWVQSTKTATFNAAQPDAPPQDQGFYQMKGFFITPASANGTGPTRSIATAGDQLRLTVRVHNYSLVDTNDGDLGQPAARVRVRVYGQKWDSEGGTLDGPAFVIGESQIASIPGFNSDSTQGTLPNWAFASVPFDTTPYADTFLVFWVVVWMEDAQGRLVAEMPGHGLEAIPSPTVDQITDVPIELHSNNVGMYGVHMPFYVAAPTAPGAEAPAAGRLAVDAVSGPAPPVIVDRKARVTATIRALGGSRDSVPVAFYDGDPARGGKLFHFQVIPHLSPDSPHLLRAFLRARLCGSHTIVVVAGHLSAGAATGVATVVVTANPDNGEGCPRTITALGPARAWVGLKNSDDVGTRFDLRAEAYIGRDLVGTGQINGVSGGGSGFNNAKLAMIPMALLYPVEAPGAHLNVRLSARIACSGRTHAAGAARLWFNDPQATSRVGITVDGVAKDYYLRSASALAGTPGPGPRSTTDISLDSKAACGARPFTPFGTWSVTLP